MIFLGGNTGRRETTLPLASILLCLTYATKAVVLVSTIVTTLLAEHPHLELMTPPSTGDSHPIKAISGHLSRCPNFPNCGPRHHHEGQGLHAMNRPEDFVCAIRVDLSRLIVTIPPSVNFFSIWPCQTEEFPPTRGSVAVPARSIDP
jgi:hypothetical protein